MDSKEIIINDIKNNIKKEMNEVKELPLKDEAGYKTVSKTWATVVSIDIVDFKKFSKTYHHSHVIKAVQAFMSQLTKVANDKTFKPAFRDIYFAGDEVIVVFDGSTRANISQALDYAFHANTIANTLIPDTLKELNYKSQPFKCGVGVWTSQYNSLVMIGNKSGNNLSTTLIGDSINNASFLAKHANRYKNHRQYDSILMNNLTYTNLVGQPKESANKFFQKVTSMFNETIYQGDVVKTKWTK